MQLSITIKRASALSRCAYVHQCVSADPTYQSLCRIRSEDRRITKSNIISVVVQRRSVYVRHIHSDIKTRIIDTHIHSLPQHHSILCCPTITTVSLRHRRNLLTLRNTNLLQTLAESDYVVLVQINISFSSCLFVICFRICRIFYELFCQVPA